MVAPRVTLLPSESLSLGVAVAHVESEVEAVGAEDDGSAFAALVAEVEPRLRRALVAAYGPEAGREATADALAWAWEHFDRVAAMERPAGYLWRVGQTSVRRQRRHERFEVAGADDVRGEWRPGTGTVGGASAAWDEELLASLRALSVHQRVAVVLVHAYGYPLQEAADVLGCRVSTLRNHLARGLRRVRADLEPGRTA